MLNSEMTHNFNERGQNVENVFQRYFRLNRNMATKQKTKQKKTDQINRLNSIQIFLEQINCFNHLLNAQQVKVNYHDVVEFLLFFVCLLKLFQFD